MNHEIKKFAKMSRQFRSKERQGIVDRPLFEKMVLLDDRLDGQEPTWRRHYPPTVADALKTVIQNRNSGKM